MDPKSQKASNASPNVEKAPSSPNSAVEVKDIMDVAQFVQTLLQQVQDKFEMMSDQILSRIDEMGHRIDDLEHNLNELMQQAGINDDGQQQAISNSAQNPAAGDANAK